MKKVVFNYLVTAAFAVSAVLFTGWSCSALKKLVSEEPEDVLAQVTSMTTAKADNVFINLTGSGEATIDWGDGNVVSKSLDDEPHSYQDYTHNYASTSSRTITITGKNITFLVCPENQLTSLDVSKNTTLKILACRSNQLIHLDVSKNTALESLFCRDNQLTHLDLSENTALIFLYCHGNQLASLDVSKNTALIELNCSNNLLTTSALNALFETLHSFDVGEQKRVIIGGNPGTNDCDRSIAENKGWIVEN